MSGCETGAFEAREKPGKILSCEFVLPDAKNAPSGFAECTVHKPVAGLVARDFSLPELGVLFGLSGVERATVPEAAVDKNGEFACAENKIRTDLKLTLVRLKLERGAPAPAGDAGGAHHRDQTKLGIFVSSAANARHDGGALRLRKDVRHPACLSLGRSTRLLLVHALCKRHTTRSCVYPKTELSQIHSMGVGEFLLTTSWVRVSLSA